MKPATNALSVCVYWKMGSSLLKHISSYAATEQDAVPSLGFAFICDLKIQRQNLKIRENESESVKHAER